MLDSKVEIGGGRRSKAPHKPPSEAWRALTALSARLWWTPQLYDEQQRALWSHQDLDLEVAFDPLTGVLSRVGFEQATTVQRQATTAPISLIALDLDTLSEINEIHGETVGDKALAYIAQRVRSGVYERDLVARVSGKEFAILLLDVHLNCAVRVAQRLCDEIRHRTRRGAWGLPPCTVSLGVTELSEPEPLSEALGRVAVALTNARRRGGDRVGASRAAN